MLFKRVREGFLLGVLPTRRLIGKFPMALVRGLCDPVRVSAGCAAVSSVRGENNFGVAVSLDSSNRTVVVMSDVVLTMPFGSPGMMSRAGEGVAMTGDNVLCF